MRQVRRAGEWVHADVGPDRVMMNVASGGYVGLSAVGARIWDLLDEARSVESICEELVRRYDVDPETCRTEVQAFLDDLAGAGAVTFDPAT
jgi:hypothetical protein